jgi:hypothetical protein
MILWSCHLSGGGAVGGMEGDIEEGGYDEGYGGEEGEGPCLYAAIHFQKFDK